MQAEAMSRRHSAEKREIIPDPKFGNVVVSKFMNSIMYAGKKSVAESIVYGAFDIIEGKTKQDPLGVFQQALDNVMPLDRGALAPRRRRHLPGAGRSAHRRAARRSASAGSSRPRAAATRRP